MPRIRSVKPEFFTDSDLCELSPLHRLLFEGLWCHADREGRLEDKPREIKVKVLPFDKCDINAMLDDLASAKQGEGFLVRYEVNGKRLIECRKFAKHQKIHKDEKPSTLPAPLEHPLSREISRQLPHEPGNREAKVPVSCLLSLGDGLLSSEVASASPPTGADGDGWKELIADLFEAFTEATGKAPEPRPKDWKALKRLRERTKKNDPEIAARFRRGLVAQFKAHVDSFWDLDDRWDALASEGPPRDKDPIRCDPNAGIIRGAS